MPASKAQLQAKAKHRAEKRAVQAEHRSQRAKPSTISSPAVRDDLPLPPNPRMQKKQKTSQASQIPPGPLMDSIYQLLYDYNFTSAVQSLRAHNQKRPGFDYHKYVNSAKGYPPLLNIWNQWVKDHPELCGTELDQVSTDEDSDDSDDSDEDEDSESDTDATAGRMDVDEKAEAEDSTSDTSDSDSSDDEGDEESEQAKAKAVPKPNGVTPTASKASVENASSDSSEDDSDSDSDSDSSSDSSSDEEAVNTAKQTPLPDSDAESSDESSEDSDEDSDSDSDSTDSSDSSSSSDSDDSEADLAKKTAAKPAAKQAPAPAVNPKKRKAEEDVDADTSAGGMMNGERAKRMKEDKERFSRIPKNVEVDPRFSSNKYQSYDYADNAHAKLIVTKGKEFTKAKNKGKKGSYRGGMIDTSMKRGIKFDD